jgi:predicted nucleic acid-binding protein
MTLVDSSVWIDHLKQPIAEVSELLATDRVLVHPMILGELSLSPTRDAEFGIFLLQLSLMDQVPVAESSEVMAMITRFKLWGRGVGWVDCHLLAAVREAHCHLLTKDKALKAAWLQVRTKG